MTLSSKLFHTAIVSASLLAASAAQADFSAVPGGGYTSDPVHAYMNFQYTHLGLSKPNLSFDDFTINLDLDKDDPTKSTINVDIDVDSIVPGSDIWKEHLSSEKWFDISNNPSITFTSTAIAAAGDNAYTVTGDLTVKGESSPITLDVTILAAKDHPMSGDPIIGMTATGQLLRSDFGLGANAPHVSDEVELSITAEMKKN